MVATDVSSHILRVTDDVASSDPWWYSPLGHTSPWQFLHGGSTGVGLSHAGPIYGAALIPELLFILPRLSQNSPLSVSLQHLVIYIQSDNLHLFICKYASFNY